MSDLVHSDIRNQTEPSIYVTGQLSGAPMQIEILFRAGIGVETHIRISQKQINFGIKDIAVCRIGASRGSSRDEWRQISSGGVRSVWGAGVSGNRVGGFGRIFRKSLRQKKGPQYHCNNST